MDSPHLLSRRNLLIASVAGASLPSIAAAEADGRDEPRVEFAFQAEVLIEPTIEIGRTPYGVRRRIPIAGGSFQGPQIRGTVIPGGADWQLERSDGYVVIEADYMIRAEDGTLIHVYNRGISNSRVPGKPKRYVRTVPRFEAPEGPHAWLNRFISVGSIEPKVIDGRSAVLIGVYKLL